MREADSETTTPKCVPALRELSPAEKRTLNELAREAKIVAREAKAKAAQKKPAAVPASDPPETPAEVRRRIACLQRVEADVADMLAIAHKELEVATLYYSGLARLPIVDWATYRNGRA
jgi:hypothetical protein